MNEKQIEKIKEKINPKKKTIKVDEITEQLLWKAVELPSDAHIEVHVENDVISFSEPLYGTSWVGHDNPRKHLDTYVGDIYALDISDFEGYYDLGNGTVEIAVPRGGQKGQYYDRVITVPYAEAIRRLAKDCRKMKDEYYLLAKELKQRKVTGFMP